MADAGPVPDANSIDMAVSTPGKDASDPDKTTARKALFQSTPKAPDKTENVSTPSTGKKRNTRENNIVIPRGCDPTMKPDNEQMGDVCKQLHFNIEEAQATAMKDILCRSRWRRCRRSIYEAYGGDGGDEDEADGGDGGDEDSYRAAACEAYGGDGGDEDSYRAAARAIVEQQRAWMDNLILTLKNFMKHEEQEQEKQQGEQEQEQVQRGRSRCRGRSSRRRSSSPSVQGDPCRSLPCAARAGLC